MRKSALKPMSVTKVIGYDESKRKTQAEFIESIASYKTQTDNIIAGLQADRRAGRNVY